MPSTIGSCEGNIRAFIVPTVDPRKVWAAIVLVMAVWFWKPVTHYWSQTEWEDRVFFEYEPGMTVGQALTEKQVWPGRYAPVSTNLYYVAMRGLGEDENHLGICHAISVALYALNMWLAYWVCCGFWPKWWALAVVLLWGSRFANVETMLWTCQMQSLMPVTFALLAMRVRREPLAATAFTFLALMSKESMVVLPFILVLMGGSLLPFAAIGAWYWMAHSTISQVGHLYWTYDLNPIDILQNFATYAVGFFHAAPAEGVPPWRLPLLQYPAAGLTLFVFGMTVPVLVPVLWTRFSDAVTPGWKIRPPVSDLFWAAAGVAIFIFALLPMMTFEDRRLMYYGYFGYFGLSLSLVAAIRWVSREG